VVREELGEREVVLRHGAAPDTADASSLPKETGMRPVMELRSAYSLRQLGVARFCCDQHSRSSP